MHSTKRIAMVTGASSGIGAEFARRLARDGFDLILVARRQDLLEQLARELGGAEILAADLTLDEDLARVAARIASAPELELLVNNAGFGARGRFWETPLDGQERMHRLHVMATLRLTRAALAAMVPRARGGVINVSSVAAFGQNPGSVSYCATKAWMNSFTEGLDLELRGIGSPVRVQALCPGYTVTGFHDAPGHEPRRHPLLALDARRRRRGRVPPRLAPGQAVRRARRHLQAGGDPREARAPPAALSGRRRRHEVGQALSPNAT
jgi:short-subunit dehydrogenase